MTMQAIGPAMVLFAGPALLTMKATAVLILAAAVHRLLGRRSPAALKHLATTTAIAIVLLLPIGAWLLPTWRINILPQPLATPSTADDIHQGWTAALILLWAAGATAVLAARLVATVATARLSRRAPIVCSGPLHDTLRDVSHGLRLRRPVTLHLGSPSTVPIAWGAIRPHLMLPVDAIEWHADRRRSAILHELSHIARHDCATQLLAQLACAVYWFNPLVWIAAARMRAERERACDDAVLSHGADPAGYAQLLVDVATAAVGQRRACSTTATAAMVGRPPLVGRVRTILDPSVNRNPTRSRAVAAVALTAIALLVVAARATPAAPATRWNVLTPDGQPAVGASVALLPPPDRCFIFNGDLNPEPLPFLPQLRTDRDGIVFMPPLDHARGLIAFGTDGFATVDAAQLAQGGAIALQPWGRIVGHLRVGQRPGAGQSVHAGMGVKQYAKSDGRLLYHIPARTDADGRFTLEHVPPGPIFVGRFLAPDGSPGTDTSGGDTTDIKELVVPAGETVTIELGGQGRPVVGQLLFPPTLVGRRDLTFDGQLNQFRRPTPMPMPVDILAAPREARHAWAAEFLKTDAGKQWQANADDALYGGRHYTAEFAPDGAFRIEDVAAGHYQFDVRIAERSATLANATVQIDLPAATIDQEPMNLPPVAMIDVDTVKRFTTGDVAPDFKLPTLDGSTMQLSQLRGSVVLLDFWSTSCTPCVEHMLSLRDVESAFAHTGRLKIVGVNSDDQRDRPLSLVRRQRIAWPQAWAATDGDRSSFGRFPVVNNLCLIGPDGSFLPTPNTREGLTSAITAAMKP